MSFEVSCGRCLSCLFSNTTDTTSVLVVWYCTWGCHKYAGGYHADCHPVCQHCSGTMIWCRHLSDLTNVHSEVLLCYLRCTYQRSLLCVCTYVRMYTSTSGDWWALTVQQDVHVFVVSIASLNRHPFVVMSLWSRSPCWSGLIVQCTRDQVHTYVLVTHMHSICYVHTHVLVMSSGDCCGSVNVTAGSLPSIQIFICDPITSVCTWCQLWLRHLKVYVCGLFNYMMGV